MTGDLALDTFYELIDADDTGGLLRALLGRQLDGGFLSDAPTALRYVVGTAVRSPAHSHLAEACELFGRMKAHDSEAPASAQMERVILRLDIAALQLGQAHLDEFARSLLDAIDVAAKSNRKANVVLTIDLGWPLLLYRMRTQPVNHAGDTSYGAILYRMADLNRNLPIAEHYEFTSLVFGTFNKIPILGAMNGDWSPALLKSPDFRRDALDWAHEVDSVAPRWGFSELVPKLFA